MTLENLDFQRDIDVLPLNQILHGDLVDRLKELPDRSVDLVVLDPPYWKIVNERWDFEWRTKQDYVNWVAQWLDEIQRVIKLPGSVYIFGYTRNLIYLYEEFVQHDFIFRQDIIVDKGKQALSGRHTSRYKMFPNTTETIWFFTHNSKPFIKDFLKLRQRELGLSNLQINERLEMKTNGGGVWSLYTGNNILAQVPTAEMWTRLQKLLEFDMPFSEVGQTFNIEMGHTNVWQDIQFREKGMGKRIHPTQKPLKLIERLIYASSNPGMVVLDPFMGSGSTAIACLNLGRNYIGVEKELEYVQASENRIANHLLKFPQTRPRRVAPNE